MSFEVQQALEQITGDEVAKKQRTVLHLAVAIATGASQRDVFKRRDTCNRVTWYGRDGGPGWHDDPAVAQALDVAKKRALWWMRVREGRAVQNALDVLVDAAPDAAIQLVRIATQGRVQVTQGDAERFVEADVVHIVKAANSILDRVSETTAQKTDITSGGKPLKAYTILANPDMWDDDSSDVAATTVANSTLEG